MAMNAPLKNCLMKNRLSCHSVNTIFEYSLSETAETSDDKLRFNPSEIKYIEIPMTCKNQSPNGIFEFLNSIPMYFHKNKGSIPFSVESECKTTVDSI